MMVVCVLFLFQAEDGIRDATVTGVQTCALPISLRADARVAEASSISFDCFRLSAVPFRLSARSATFFTVSAPWLTILLKSVGSRSEERRVGKRVEIGGGRVSCEETSSRGTWAQL